MSDLGRFELTDNLWSNKLTGFEGAIEWDTNKPHGQPRRVLNTERVWQAFGFRAKTDFKTGLRRTIEGCRRSLDRGSAGIGVRL